MAKVAVVGEAPSLVGEAPNLTGEFIEKCAREEQGICTVPSLAPAPQALLLRSKDGCLDWVNT